MTETKKNERGNTINMIGMVIGLILFVAGGVLVGISKLASVNPNPYLSQPDLTSILYSILFGVGFVVFVSFLTVIVEERRGIH